MVRAMPPPLFSFELDCTLPDFLELWDDRYAEYLAANHFGDELRYLSRGGK